MTDIKNYEMWLLAYKNYMAMKKPVPETIIDYTFISDEEGDGNDGSEDRTN